MRIHGLRLGVALMVLVAVPTAAYVVDSATPPAREPATSAFGTGGANTSVLADVARESGYETAAVVSTLALLADVQDAAATVLVVVAPAAAPTASERRTLDDFLASGGSILILDPRGGFNPWLVALGVGVLDVPLLDPSADEADIVELGSGLSPAASVLARQPGKLSVEPDTAWTDLLVAPAHVHLDLNRNGTVERVEQAGPHSVGAILATSTGGHVAVVADASALSDELMGHAGNQAWARGLLESLLPGGGLVLFDETRHGWTQNEPPAAILVAASQRLADVGLPWLVGALLASAVLLLAPTVVVPGLRPLTPHEGRVPVDPPPPVGHDARTQAAPEAPRENYSNPDQGGTQT